MKTISLTHAASHAYNVSMFALTDIAAVFKLASDESTPDDDDLQRLNKVLVIFCLGVTLTGKNSSCASGVVLPNRAY